MKLGMNVIPLEATIHTSSETQPANYLLGTSHSFLGVNQPVHEGKV